MDELLTLLRRASLFLSLAAVVAIVASLDYPKETEIDRQTRETLLKEDFLKSIADETDVAMSWYDHLKISTSDLSTLLQRASDAKRIVERDGYASDCSSFLQRLFYLQNSIEGNPKRRVVEQVAQFARDSVAFAAIEKEWLQFLWCCAKVDKLLVIDGEKISFTRGLSYAETVFALNIAGPTALEVRVPLEDGQPIMTDDPFVYTNAGDLSKIIEKQRSDLAETISEDSTRAKQTIDKYVFPSLGLSMTASYVLVAYPFIFVVVNLYLLVLIGHVNTIADRDDLSTYLPWSIAAATKEGGLAGWFFRIAHGVFPWVVFCISLLLIWFSPPALIETAKFLKQELVRAGGVSLIFVSGSFFWMMTQMSAHRVFKRNS